MDVLEHFIEDTCRRNENSTANAKELFEAYKKWADESGEYKMNKNQFGKKMKEKFEAKRTKHGIVYKDLEIIQHFPGIQGIL